LSYGVVVAMWRQHGPELWHRVGNLRRRRTAPKGEVEMKSLLVRRRHVSLDQALTAMSDTTIPRKDAVIMWRKALRRADAPTKELLSRVAKLHPKKRRPILPA
jgi:hypothetical protein